MISASEIVPTKKFEAITLPSAPTQAVKFLTNTYPLHPKDSQPKWLTRFMRVRSVSILVGNFLCSFLFRIAHSLNFIPANNIVQAQHILALPTTKEAM